MRKLFETMTFGAPFEFNTFFGVFISVMDRTGILGKIFPFFSAPQKKKKKKKSSFKNKSKLNIEKKPNQLPEHFN